MSGAPLVGICAAIERVSWGAWSDVPCTMLPSTYSLAVQRAGGIALLLPPDDSLAEQPGELIDLLDGLVLAGGSDVDAGSYGAAPHQQTRGTWPERDRFELALGTAALERELPLLGICRGMQVLNVTAGGTLEQHVPERVGHDDHRHTPGAFADHGVRLEEGSLAARVVGETGTAVKSHHHQGVAELGEGVSASGWAEDGVIEAIELSGRRFALGVLWHPEQDESSGVIGALVDEARRFHAER